MFYAHRRALFYSPVAGGRCNATVGCGVSPRRCCTGISSYVLPTIAVVVAVRRIAIRETRDRIARPRAEFFHRWRVFATAPSSYTDPRVHGIARFAVNTRIYNGMQMRRAGLFRAWRRPRWILARVRELLKEKSTRANATPRLAFTCLRRSARRFT